jgi:membrane associated rhomboid family serine protease
MFILGVLIAIASAVAFAALGLVTLFGGARSTREQIIPGFVPERAGGVERLLTLGAVWIPVIVVTIFGVYAAYRIIEMVIQALA